MRKFIAIVAILLLLLCSCRSVKTVERVDTVRVERVVEAAHGAFEAQVVHDTTSVEIVRYDTLERVTERVVYRRGKVETKWRHDTVPVRDTVKVQSTKCEVQSTERVAVAEPVEWRKWAAVAVLVLLAVAALWIARKIGNWTDIR